MQCPVCKDIALVMTERQSIEIDYCPQCRGVWLDRGELDKIIERSQQQESGRFLPQNSPIQRQEGAPTQPAQPAQPAYAQPAYSQHSEQPGHHGGGWRDGHQNTHQSGHHNQGGHHGQQTHHKKSFLREMFD